MSTSIASQEPCSEDERSFRQRRVTKRSSTRSEMHEDLGSQMFDDEVDCNIASKKQKMELNEEEDILLDTGETSDVDALDDVDDYSFDDNESVIKSEDALKLAKATLEPELLEANLESVEEGKGWI